VVDGSGEWVDAAETLLRSAKDCEEARKSWAPLARAVAAFYLTLLEANVAKPEAAVLCGEFLRAWFTTWRG